MCSYNITLDDTLVAKVKSSFANEQDLASWLQQQIENILLKYSVQEEMRNRARKAVLAMRQKSAENGNSEMTLDEINEEIRQARQNRKKAIVQ